MLTLLVWNPRSLPLEAKAVHNGFEIQTSSGGMCRDALAGTICFLLTAERPRVELQPPTTLLIVPVPDGAKRAYSNKV